MRGHVRHLCGRTFSRFGHRLRANRRHDQVLIGLPQLRFYKRPQCGRFGAVQSGYLPQPQSVLVPSSRQFTQRDGLLASNEGRFPLRQ